MLAVACGLLPLYILSQIEEFKLVAHVKDLAAVGYGYTRTEIFTMATDYAVHPRKRRKDDKCYAVVLQLHGQMA